MTDPTLERRYRRLLALYPRSFRAEHGDEMLSVLLSGAAAGQTRPRPGEVTDAVRHGLGRRLRGRRYPGSWERDHARLMFPLRLAIATWLVFLTSVLYGYGRGGLWGVVLVPAIGLHLLYAYRLRPSERVTRQPG